MIWQVIIGIFCLVIACLLLKGQRCLSWQDKLSTINLKRLLKHIYYWMPKKNNANYNKGDSENYNQSFHANTISQENNENNQKRT
jgi:hypothetical protein